MLSNWELSDLASHLRLERLFISSEQQNLQILNEKIKSISTNFAQLAWISSHQRINLSQLILAKVDCLPALTCQRNFSKENVIFVDACKVIGYQDALAYGEFLTFLHDNVELLARCLSVGDKLFPDSMPEIVYSLSAGLFGSCLLPEDKITVLKLLQQLTVLQLVPSDNPRRLLRHGSCAFARFYSLYHENLYSGKLFLTAALHAPIMKLLMEDEMFLDIDPDKAVIRFPPEERLKKFGSEGTPEYTAKLQKHREWIVKKLVHLTEYFILSLREQMHCFPNSVCWLVRQMAGLFTKSDYLGEKEIYEICIDLVFTYFICPAIVNPEPYGITDVPIGYIARFNLMQIAQILQMLAIRKYEDVDSRVADLYNQFHSDCVSSFVDRILEDSTECLEEQPPIEENTDIEGVSRSAALFTHSQLNNLVKFFQNLLHSDSDTLDKRQLETLISRLPPVWTNGYKSTSNKFQTDKPSGSTQESSILRKPSVLLSKVNRQKSHSIASGGIGGLLSTNDSVDDGRGEEEPPEQILVLPLSGREYEPIGLMPELKVLELEGKRQVDVIPIGVEETQDLGDGGVRRHGEGPEKRTRFSLSHDEGSIGNTSDNLEAVSEAASNHSGASSLESENEDQNDNLSDMVSANVSGRGTPNISGRDTPSSQITEGDEGRVGEEEIRGGGNEHRQVVPAVSKQTRSDIDDKFGKFEIRKQEVLGDETTSLVSDTWSTDVLASDSETVEQSERNFPRPPEADGPHPFIQHSLDISETASEAWSTDVLTSDSERLTEVDTDDTASVARSDDTAHSEFGVRGEAEGGETPPPHSSAIFRPIKEPTGGRVSLAVPPSPTRGDMWNVTGRGGVKSDYRRRTLEFVDSGLVRNYHKSSTNTLESSRMIHVIDKIDSSKATSTSTSLRIGRSGSTSRSRSPQPSQSQPLSNGIENPLPEPNPVPNDHVQKLSIGNCNLSVGEPDMAALSLLDRNSDANEEAAALFDDSDITPPSPLLSNPFPPPSLLPSNSLYLNNHKPQTSYPLPYKYNEIKLKQEAEESERVFLSSTSLASTSSSGSNSGVASQSQSGVRNGEKVNMGTGAIPKSISFDKTAERGDKEFLDDDQKQRKGFFRNLKMSFKNRKLKHFKGDDLGRFDENIPNPSGDSYDNVRSRGEIPEESRTQNGDAIEDILAKYRSKPPVETGDLVPNVLMGKKVIEADEDEGLSDASIFENAKRKLRLVLCNSDSHIRTTGSVMSEDQLVSFLKLQLAEAINLQNRSLVSQLQETLRCVRLFDHEGCRRLFKSLKEDYQNRAPYVAYLIRSRQTLLSSIAHFERMTERIESDGRVYRKFLVALCVGIFLERREDLCQSFSKEFQQLTLADEKTDLLDKFLTDLSYQLEKDHSWTGASASQLEEAKSIIETAIISRVYPYALYPNGDVDRYRDRVLHEHMKKLASVITPNHKDLQIPKIFHVECPWPSAQAEISALAAYKTPKDKVSCICRCATTIMNLLSMAVDGNVPAADDFVPVLVFVLILANPPALLSTVQYVDSFYGSRLEGEEQYWWTQFSSAIEFIKTMD